MAAGSKIKVRNLAGDATCKVNGSQRKILEFCSTTCSGIGGDRYFDGLGTITNLGKVNSPQLLHSLSLTLIIPAESTA